MIVERGRQHSMGDDARAEDGLSASVEQDGLAWEKLPDLKAPPAVHQHVPKIEQPVEPAGGTGVLDHRVEISEECALIVVALVNLSRGSCFLCFYAHHSAPQLNSLPSCSGRRTLARHRARLLSCDW